MKPSSNKTRTRSQAASPAPKGRSILPGAFVHRMGEDAGDEKRAAEFWQSKGIAVESLENERERYSSLPDFRLLRNGQPWAYCEVKTIWKHSWAIRVLHQERPITERSEVTEKPVEERIGADLVTALRQLRAGNPEHSLLNIVMLINKDPEVSHELVTRRLSRQGAISAKGLAAKREARLEEELREFHHESDLCIWVNGMDETGFMVEGYFLPNPKVEDRAEEIRELGFKKQIRLEPAA